MYRVSHHHHVSSSSSGYRRRLTSTDGLHLRVDKQHYSGKIKTDLILIDANAFLYRNFFGMPVLSNSGEQLHAVFGFLKNIIKIMAMYDYRYIGVCFDTKKSFRKDIDPEYKNNRSSYPPLSKQIVIAKSFLDVMTLGYIEREGFEADDIIATYANEAKNMGLHVIILSPDKDFIQLVNETTVLHRNGLKDVQNYDIDTVVKMWNITPSQFPFLQSLMGDNADGVKGIKGIGVKKATKIIQHYGTIDSLIENVNDYPVKSDRKILQDNLEQIQINYKLVKLDMDVTDIPSLIPNLQKKIIDMDGFTKKLEEYKFKSIIGQLKQKKILKNEEIVQKKESISDLYQRCPETINNFEPIDLSKSTEELRSEITQNICHITVVNDYDSAEFMSESLEQYKDRNHFIYFETDSAKILSFQIYLGEDVNFGNGTTLWVDNLDQSHGTISCFKSYLENPNIKKILFDSKDIGEALSIENIVLKGIEHDISHMTKMLDMEGKIGDFETTALVPEKLREKKVDRFGWYKKTITKKAVKVQKTRSVPPSLLIQRDSAQYLNWVHYTSYNPKCMYQIYHSLMGKFNKQAKMKNYYENYWHQFGIILNNLNNEKVNVYKMKVQKKMRDLDESKSVHYKLFSSWIETLKDEYKGIDFSKKKIEHLLFGLMDEEKEFQVRDFSDNRSKFFRNSILKIKKENVVGLGLPSILTTNTGKPILNAENISYICGIAMPLHNGIMASYFKETGTGEEACEALFHYQKCLEIEETVSLLKAARTSSAKFNYGFDINQSGKFYDQSDEFIKSIVDLISPGKGKDIILLESKESLISVFCSIFSREEIDDMDIATKLFPNRNITHQELEITIFLKSFKYLKLEREFLPIIFNEPTDATNQILENWNNLYPDINILHQKINTKISTILGKKYTYQTKQSKEENILNYLNECSIEHNLTKLISLQNLIDLFECDIILASNTYVVIRSPKKVIPSIKNALADNIQWTVKESQKDSKQ